MINAIFATDATGAMGMNGTMPWPKHQHDMKWFQDHTMGHVVVMGRKTFDDPAFPKPLPGRICYVLTNRPGDLPIYGRGVKGDMGDVLAHIQHKHPDKKIFVIGGPAVLEEARPYLDRVFMTVFKGSHRADVRIQVKEFLTGFQVKRCDTSPDFACSFLKYENIFRRPLPSIE
jgi:dihydrofolate reductase